MVAPRQCIAKMYTPILEQFICRVSAGLSEINDMLSNYANFSLILYALIESIKGTKMTTRNLKMKTTYHILVWFETIWGRFVCVLRNIVIKRVIHQGFESNSFLYVLKRSCSRQSTNENVYIWGWARTHYVYTRNYKLRVKSCTNFENWKFLSIRVKFVSV